MPHPVLIFDGTAGMAHRDFERGEVNFLSAGLGSPYRLVYCSDALIFILLRGNKLWFLFLPFILSFRRAIDYALGSILDLYVLLSLREDVPYPGDFILYQMIVEERETCNLLMNAAVATSSLHCISVLYFVVQSSNMRERERKRVCNLSLK